MREEIRRAFVRLTDRFLQEVRVLSWSHKTVESYTKHLSAFVEFITAETDVQAITDVTHDVLFRYQTYLFSWTSEKGRGLAIATQKARLSAVRSFFRHLARTGVVPYDPSATLTLPRRKQPLPRSILTKREVTRLLAAPDTTKPLGLRDRAMLEMLYSTGMRNAELRGLKLYDVDLQRGLVRLNATKNGKDRVVPLGRAARASLKSYLEEVRPRLARTNGADGEDDKAVFLTKSGLPLYPLDVINPVRRHARRARIRKHVTPHTLRHTFATHMLRGRADLRHIQAMLGHGSIASTEIYLRVEVTDLKAVLRRCHPREQR